MTQGKLRSVISQKIQDVSLNQDQLDRLNNLQAEKPKHISNKILYFFAAIITVTFTTIVIQQSVQQTISIEQAIGNEVAKNHIKLKPLEVTSTQLNIVRSYFKELDFLPIASKNINFDTQKLLGGRYCSIQGITAAQLRLKNDKTGNIQSFYQTSYDPALFKGIPNISAGEQPITVHSKGISVEIWVEKGLLFAVTKD